MLPKKERLMKKYCEEISPKRAENLKKNEENFAKTAGDIWFFSRAFLNFQEWRKLTKNTIYRMMKARKGQNYHPAYPQRSRVRSPIVQEKYFFFRDWKL